MMNGLEHYAVLSGATVIIVLLTIGVWLKTRQVAFVAGFVFLYYWSLYGAWAVIARNLGSSEQYRFEYMFQKLFPVYLDQDYVNALLLYTLFIVTVQLTVLMVARRPPRCEPPHEPLRLDHRVTIVAGVVLACGAVWLVRDVLSVAATMDISPYAIVGAIQSGNNPQFTLPFFTLYQLLNQASLGSLTLGLVVLLSGDEARYIVGRQRVWPGVLYAIALSAIFGVDVLMGNRSTLVFAILPSGLFYLANARRINKKLIVVGAVVAGFAIVLPGILRSASAVREMAGLSLTDRATYVMTEAFSQQSEAFATHASMYGALARHVPLTYGSSFVWLSTSLIPSIIRPEVVPVIYTHYAINVGAARDQGFTIHHATGWYLNFGLPGLVLGGIVFGWIWAFLLNKLQYPYARRGYFARVFFTIAVWNFTGFIPTLIRGGPESYKGLLTEALLIPSAIVILGTVTIVLRHNRPRVVPAHQTSVA